MEQGNEVLKSHCNECLSNTHHDLLAQCLRDYFEEDDDGRPVGFESTRYQLVRCRGCENVSLRRTYSCSWNENDEVDYFPPAITRKLPQWLNNIGCLFQSPQKDIRELFLEVYSALHAGNNRLAMMGIRTIVDLSLTDKLGDVGGFAVKLTQAKDKGWITPIHHDILNAAVDAGNAAAHRAFKPNAAQLDEALDIVEHLIQLLYILEHKAKSLARQTPCRIAKKNP